MTPRAKWAVTTAIMLTVAASCGNDRKQPPAVPRPVAYPRVELYQSEYTDTTLPGLSLPVNASALVTVTKKNAGTSWIDVAYPNYNATLRLTLSYLNRKQLMQAIDNRLTRMSLNTGGNTTEITELKSPAGISSTILVSPEATVTPIQILSTDSTGILLSGALEITGQEATPEEIAPIVNAVKEDIIHTAKHLTRP